MDHGGREKTVHSPRGKQDSEPGTGSQPLMEAMRQKQMSGAVNGPSWGLADFELPDEALLPGQIASTAVHPRSYNAPAGQPVTALL